MELTTEDKQRIDEWVRNYKSATEPLTLSEKLCLRFGAEYATIYERERGSDYALELLEDLYSENVARVKQLEAERGELLNKINQRIEYLTEGVPDERLLGTELEFLNYLKNSYENRN